MKTRARPETKCGADQPAEGWITAGWMGLTLHAPEDWSPVSVSGEGENGYLKLVGPDTRYLEVKWERPKGVVSVPKSLEGYFGRLRKAAKKSRQELRFRERPKGMGGVRPQSQAPIAYAWESDRKAVGCIWHCGECNRLVIAELVGELDDDLSPAGAILKGIRDHGEDGWNTWALYGLTLPAPTAYRVEKQVLMTGHQRFQLRERGSTLEADRWGLAEIALRGATLRQWYESREQSRLGRYAYTVEEVELHGHPALRFHGRDRIPFAVMKVFKSGSTMVWPRFFLEGYVWHCPETNRIYALFGEQPRKSPLMAEVAERMRCH